MEVEDLVAQFVTEVARRGVDHLVARTAPGRCCAHCRNDDLLGFSATLPCCGRVLCERCASKVCVHKWERRCVIVCDECRTAHTFEAVERSGDFGLVLVPH